MHLLAVVLKITNRRKKAAKLGVFAALKLHYGKNVNLARSISW
jgi:hypothetical protein